jgi:hypothetical protein
MSGTIFLTSKIALDAKQFNAKYTSTSAEAG